MFRDIVTYKCYECQHEWVAPHLPSVVKCPKCHSERTGAIAATVRREEAPRV